MTTDEPRDFDTDPGSSVDDGLLDRLSLIEDQPLAERAESYAQIHTQLSDALQRSDQQRPDQQRSAQPPGRN